MLPIRYRRRQGGFSLIELLIVIAIILIILAVALPRLSKARMFAQEMAGMKAINTIHTAETQYYSTYGRYAASLQELGPPTSGAAGPQAADLVDRELAAGEKGGYKFVLTPTPTGYSLNVQPTSYGTTGSKTFFSDQTMSVHQHFGQEPATANDQLVGESAAAPGQAAPAPAAK